MKHILIVEDDISLMKLIQEILEDHGFHTTGCEDGQSGLEAIKNNDYDLVITDIIMPKKTGLSLIRSALNIKPDLKFIAMSAGRDIEAKKYLEAAEKYGVKESIQKPIKSLDLVAAVEKVLS